LQTFHTGFWEKRQSFTLSSSIFPALILSFSGTAQDFSNKGKDFWIVYPDHIDVNNSSMGIYITSDVNTSGTIRAGNATIAFTVTANSITRKFLGPNNQGDASNIGIVNNLADGTVSNAGIRVTAEKPVVVYAHIIRSARSGATLVLPVNVLGKEYIVPSHQSAGANGINSGYAEVTLVAPQPNTLVEITPVANSRDGVRKPGIPYTVLLQQPGDVYQIQFEKDVDISGTRVRSLANDATGCKPIAVFSATTWSAFPCIAATGGDNLFQQLFPVKSWGKTFLTSPFIDRPYDIIRVFVSDRATAVKKTENGQTTILGNLSASGFYEFTTNQPTLIEADQPISVVQYLISQSCGISGTNADPEMVILNPIEQTINNITVFSAHQNWVPPGQSNVNSCYLNIIIKKAFAGSFRINGSPPASAFKDIPGTDYQYLQENISQLAATNPIQNLKADSTFIAIAYGYGQYESYGYNAGTSVKDLSQYIEVSNLLASVNYPATCRDAPFNLSVVLSYLPQQITWTVPAISLDTTLLNPVPDSTWTADNKTLYRFKLKKSLHIPVTGAVPVKVFTNNPTADGCGNLQEINYELEVLEKPVAAFSYLTNGCAADSVRLTDLSQSSGDRVLNRWFWQTGDNQQSGAKNPSFLFKAAGEQTVRLAVVTDIGCISDTTFKNIALSVRPDPEFTVSSPGCIDLPVIFTDITPPAGAIISRRYWDTGSGLIDSGENNNPRIAQYAAAGTYTVSLALKTSTGCLSNLASRQIVISPNPSAAFQVPKVCLNDALAQFQDSSTINGIPAFGLSYAWDFGDGGRSTQQNPAHKFNAADNYTVSLLVVTAPGCRDSVARVFTVNGAVPRSAFTVLDTANLCSNKAVVLQNASTVDFGNITRLEIIWDLLQNPAEKITDENPQPGKTYEHLYGDFGSPQSTNFTIRMIAWSGITCVSESTMQITVKASPQLVFTPPTALCEDHEPVQLNGAMETSGLTGTATFSGAGVSASGLFSPQLAGPGNHPIRYSYTSTGGCAAFLEQSLVVNATPRVDAGPDRTVLEGGYITLSPTVTGNNLQYSWIPANGLDNPAILNPRASPGNDITYTLEVTTAEGCKDADEVFVKVLRNPRIPNTFTPNADGYNDVWEITNLDSYPGCIIEVYNPQGQLVFRSVGYNKPWDGTWNGKALPAGTYYYVVDPKNGRSKTAGYVTIFK
jgi:gliding motility-associated-like protein